LAKLPDITKLLENATYGVAEALVPAGTINTGHLQPNLADFEAPYRIVGHR